MKTELNKISDYEKREIVSCIEESGYGVLIVLEPKSKEILLVETANCLVEDECGYTKNFIKENIFIPCYNLAQSMEMREQYQKILKPKHYFLCELKTLGDNRDWVELAKSLKMNLDRIKGGYFVDFKNYCVLQSIKVFDYYKETNL
jgi:hypothetical protein